MTDAKMALLGRLLQKLLRVGAQRRRVQRAERSDTHEADRAPRPEGLGVDDREAAGTRGRRLLDEKLGLRALSPVRQ